MALYEEDIEYTRRNLVGTIVRTLRGTPVFVEDIEQREEFNFYVRSMKSGKLLNLSRNKLNFVPPQLGFINNEGKATYCCRKPMRHDWRQGLRINNMKFYNANFVDLPKKNFTDMIQNKYPSYKEAYEDRQGNMSIAFSKKFGVQQDKLLYKDRVVGTCGPQPQLEEKYMYLNEILQEVLDENRT